MIGLALMPRPRSALDSFSAVAELPDDAWDDRCAFAVAGVQAGLAGQRQEQCGQFTKPPQVLRLAADRADRRERCRRGGWWHADAVDEARRRVLEELDELPASADVAAAAGQRLRHRARPELDVGAVDAEVFADATAGRAEHADAVRLVDHEQRLVLALDRR